MASNPWKAAAHALAAALSGWIHRERDAIVAYQKEEIRVMCQNSDELYAARR